MSKDELMSTFYERPSEWGEHQFTYCLVFAKGPRFSNMVMTFILYPLSHYNSIMQSCAHFLLSLLEHLTINFPSHFILSLIDLFQDSASRDKLIFPSAITRILCPFSVPFPASDPFTFMCAIDATAVKCSKAQFRSQQQDSTPPDQPTPSHSAQPTSAPSSSSNDVSLGDIMAQLQRMDARLDKLSTELYQVNIRVGCIARRQATIAALIVMTMMLRMMMMEMLALPMRCLLETLTLCHSWQKGRVVLDMRVVILKGSVVFIEGCSKDALYLFFSFLFRYIVLVHEVLWPFIDIHCTYLFHLWLMYVFLSPTLSCVVSFPPLYTYCLLFVCNLLFLFHTKMPWWVFF